MSAKGGTEETLEKNAASGRAEGNVWSEAKINLQS